MRPGYFDLVVDSPVGRLGVGLESRRVREIAFLSGHAALRAPVDAAGRRVAAWLQAYFTRAADVPRPEVVLTGTDFQKRVWQALAGIAPGQVITYGALAQRLGGSARAVGNACRHNPVPILVPCHRVVSARGLGGFAGDSSGPLVDIKRRLLAHEGVEICPPRPHVSG